MSAEQSTPPNGSDRLGSPAWLAATGGIVSQRRDRLRLVGRLYREVPARLADLARVQRWKRRPSHGRIDASLFDPPSSAPAAASKELCRTTLGESMLNHSMRTWVFAAALARRDGDHLDADLLFVATMLHDLGLAQPTYGVCFTKSGVDAVPRLPLVQPLATDEQLIVQSAISHHVTPGLRKQAEGVYAVYVQRGSLLDLTGARASLLPLDFVRHAYHLWPPLTIRPECGLAWRREAKHVHHGRAHILQRWGRFSTLIRFSPLPPTP